MNHHLTFGKYLGRSFEWVFFHDPKYAQWLHEQNVLSERQDYSVQDKAYFKELYRRADGLKGRCCKCRQPAVRMEIGALVGLQCERILGMYWGECKDESCVTSCLVRISFFATPMDSPKKLTRVVMRMLKCMCFGPGYLRQDRIERFFRQDANFTNATLGFFDAIGKEVEA